MRAATAPTLPISVATLDRWIRAGVILLERPGSGTRRDYPSSEVRAVRAVDACTRLAGVVPGGVPWSPSSKVLYSTVAELARSESPGTAHRITTPVPWITHVVIVPEP